MNSITGICITIIQQGVYATKEKKHQGPQTKLQIKGLKNKHTNAASIYFRKELCPGKPAAFFFS